MGFETSKEMFINIKDKPIYDTNKHFYDQSKDVIQFYEEEHKKITQGINIGGYFVHPWMYFHLNFFVTPIPTLDNYGNVTDVIQNPPLDDNFFYIIENYKEAKEKGKILFLFGTRGFAKSVNITSLTNWTMAIQPNGKFSIMGGSTSDLKNISSLMETAFTKIHPAFYLPTIKKDWNSYVEFGFKEKNQYRMTHSEIFISNFDKGVAKESEKGAGLTPVGLVLDECGKSDFWKVLESAIPSFKSQYGWRFVPLISGTGGNIKLSQDAKKLLRNPEEYGVLPMNYDRLNNIVPEEYITWDSKKKFGTFVPGQMTYREVIPRIPKKFSDFLGKKSKGLDKITIQTTNWEVADQVLKDLIDKPGLREEDRLRSKMYYPRDTDDCFLTESKNPFPVKIIDRHIRELEDKGRYGKDISIYRENGKFKYESVSKKRAEVHHNGGNIEAPIVLFGHLEETPPEKYTLVSGLDDYKVESSDTDSLGAFYVLKRRHLAPNEPCEKIVLSYVSRPDKHIELHNTIELIQEATNAECLMESVDVIYQRHLETKHKAEQFLAPAISFGNVADTRQRLTQKYGLYPHKANNSYRFNLLIDYCKEEHTIGVDSDGYEIIKYGVEFIDDIDLLKEMLNYTPEGNFDRIVAFSHALVLSRELDKRGVRPRGLKNGYDILSNENTKRKNDRPKMSMYSFIKGLKKY